MMENFKWEKIQKKVETQAGKAEKKLKKGLLISSQEAALIQEHKLYALMDKKRKKEMEAKQGNISKIVPSEKIVHPGIIKLEEEQAEQKNPLVEAPLEIKKEGEHIMPVEVQEAENQGNNLPVEPPKEEEEIPRLEEERDHPVRAAAWHTVHKVDKFTDLDAPTEKEREEKFLELTRKLWDEFSVHGGDKKPNPDTGMIEIPRKSDLDGESCLKLFELAGFHIDRDKVNFVEKGLMPDSGVIVDTSEKKGVILDKKGERFIVDHHTPDSERYSSATKYLYDTLDGMGLLEKNPDLDKYVEFVTKCDSLYFDPEEEQKVYENYSKNLYGLHHKIKLDDIIELLKQGTDPAEKLSDDYLKKYIYFNTGINKEETLLQYSEYFQKKINEGEKIIDKLAKEGFVVDTGADRFGKILIDTKKINDKGSWYPKVDSENHSGQLSLRQKGYGGYLLWSQVENGFMLYTTNRMDETSIPGGVPGAKNMRGSMLFKNQSDTEPLNLKMEDLFSKLIGKEFEFEKKIKEKIDIDLKVKEIDSLIFKGGLTEDILRQSAKELKISLKRFLGEIMEQLPSRNKHKSVEKIFEDRVKKIPQGKDTVAERDRIAVQILLEYQEKKNGANGKIGTMPNGPGQIPPKNLPTAEDEKREKISNSVKKMTSLFSNFELSYEAIIEEAKIAGVKPSELALQLIQGNDKLKMKYNLRLNSVFPSIKDRDEEAVELVAIVIILQDEKRRVEEKIRLGGESDILRIRLRKIKADLLKIKTTVKRNIYGSLF